MNGGGGDENGPKRRVFASFGPLVSFFIYFHFSLCFSILNDVFYSYYWYYKGTEGFMGGNYDENGPKRRVSRRLGHW